MPSVIKYNLSDVTFVIPIRIDSEERKANIETLLKVLLRDFDTNIIVLEADKTQLFIYPTGNITYYFIPDKDPVFHRTKYINQLLRFAQTPVVAVWDVDAIGIPIQILDAVEQIRNHKAVMAFPYDGRFYDAGLILSNLFRQALRYNVFTENTAVMHLMHGYYSVGGAYMVNKEEYIKVGGENENFYGWKLEDAERVRRMEIYNLPVYYAPGMLFQLWHPRNDSFDDHKADLKNRRELLTTCQQTKKLLKTTVL